VDGALYFGADIGRRRDRTAIWIDQFTNNVAMCRGVPGEFPIQPKNATIAVSDELGVNLDVYKLSTSTNGKMPWRCWIPHWHLTVGLESPQVVV
jgi:hypothetical protein